MSFQALNIGQKMVALGFGATCVGGFVAYKIIPFNTDLYKTLWHVYEIPKFKREMILKEFESLKAAENDCLLKKHLTLNLVENLKQYKTKHNCDLLTLWKEAIHYPKSEIGVNPTDFYAYDVFQPLLDPIIADLHGNAGQTIKKRHPTSDWGEEKHDYFQPLDAEKKYIKNAWAECVRTIRYYLFNPTSVESDLYHFETIVGQALDSMTANSAATADPDLKGQTYWFRKMDTDEVKKVDGDFRTNDERLKVCGVYNFWPIGRGVFKNEAQNLTIRLNEEEHMKFIAKTDGTDIKPALQRLAKSTKAIGKAVSYAFNERIGNPTFSLKNIGSGLTVFYELNLPKLSRKDDFIAICKGLKLNAEPTGQTVKVFNAQKLGLTEYETAKMVYDGVKKLLEMEEQA